MWIAGLPGRPHTFTQKDYWSFCESKHWPDAGRSIRVILLRFAELGMVTERTDLHKSRGGRSKFWTRTPSPLWEIFAQASDVIVTAPQDEGYVPSEAKLDLTRWDLVGLARELVEVK
jgi:hypothetical protein